MVDWRFWGERVRGWRAFVRRSKHSDGFPARNTHCPSYADSVHKSKDSRYKKKGKQKQQKNENKDMNKDKDKDKNMKGLFMIFVFFLFFVVGGAEEVLGVFGGEGHDVVEADLDFAGSGADEFFEFVVGFG